MSLQKMLDASLNVNLEDARDYPTIMRGMRSIISGMDGVGKTTFALSVMKKEYEQNNNLVCVYIDSDDKSAKQVRKFATYFKDVLHGQYLNLPLINKDREESKKFTMLSFILRYTNKLLYKDKQYMFLIDNMTHLTGVFENDNSAVTAVRMQLEDSILKLPNVRIMLIAHSGKAATGMRGATSMRAAFGEELQICKDMEFGIVAEVRKDSEDYHNGTTLYKLDLIDKETFDMDYKELSGRKLVEDKAAYQAKRLEDIVISLIEHIQTSTDSSRTVVANTHFTRAVYLLASPSELHTDDKNYLTPNFVAKGLNALYAKLGIELTKHPEHKYMMFDSSLIDLSLVSKGTNKVAVSEQVHMLLITKAMKSASNTKQELYDISEVETAVIEALSNAIELTGEGMRLAVYKDTNVKPTSFSKAFAKDKLPTALSNLIDTDVIECIAQGRKKTYKLLPNKE